MNIAEIKKYIAVTNQFLINLLGIFEIHSLKAKFYPPD